MIDLVKKAKHWKSYSRLKQGEGFHAYAEDGVQRYWNRVVNKLIL